MKFRDCRRCSPAVLPTASKDLRWLTPEQLHEIEPHAAGVAAVHVPQEGIADYPAVCRALSSEIHARGEVITGAEVRAIQREGSTWRVVTGAGDYQADRIVTCAGLYADRVAALTGKARGVRIVPFRGEYYGIRPERQYLVRNLIYPVPDPAFPFLGVHYTRMIHGGIEAGPNAVLALAGRLPQERRARARSGRRSGIFRPVEVPRQVLGDVLDGGAPLL